MAKLYLEKENFKVHTAKDTKRARKLLTIVVTDLIICDIGMPNENGIEFTKWLKGEEKYKHIPVFLISAHALNMGYFAEHSDVLFFEKPLFFPNLIERIREILGENT